jgi:hypothetical protein
MEYFFVLVLPGCFCSMLVAVGFLKVFAFWDFDWFVSVIMIMFLFLCC